MSEWKKVKLGELCDFINGGAWSDKEYAPEGIPVLKVTNCKNSGFSLSELSYLPYSLEQKYIQNKLQRNDVIIATVGSHPNLVNSSAGRSVIVNSFVEGFYLNQNAVCIRTKDEEILNQLFWGYYSKYYLFQNYIQMRGKGAANQMRIAISAIKDYPMPLPPINVQSHIASILSRYDSLIENYQKQIKLLEEAAQRLYKEWFVDLHFPGHENTKIVNGVPEGWEKKKVGEIANISAGGDKPEVVTEEKTTCCQVPIYSNGTTKEGLYGYTNKSSNIAGSITVSARGSIGFACLRMHDYFSIVRLISIKPYQNEDLMYLFQFAKVHTFISNGAAQQQLTVPMVKAIDIVYPTGVLLKAFESAVLPIYKQIEFLKSQIRLLTEARDRLLPKLMSGEIAV